MNKKTAGLFVACLWIASAAHAAKSAAPSGEFENAPERGMYARASEDYSLWMIQAYEIPTPDVEVVIACLGGQPIIRARNDDDGLYITVVHCDGAKAGEKDD